MVWGRLFRREGEETVNTEMKDEPTKLATYLTLRASRRKPSFNGWASVADALRVERVGSWMERVSIEIGVGTDVCGVLR